MSARMPHANGGRSLADEAESNITPENPRPRDEALADGEACRKAALEYLDRGWAPSTCCPPDHVGVGKGHAKNCTKPGKAPWGLWKEFQERLPTIDELTKKWRENPCLNVGMFLGPVSGMVRIDIDGEAGEKMLRDLCGPLPDTLEFTSGGNGRGLLFQIPENVTIKTTSKAGEGLHAEVRFQAKGAQTVLPPSRHASGRYYAWAPGAGRAKSKRHFYLRNLRS